MRGSGAALAAVALALLAAFVPPAGGATTLRAYVLADASLVDPGDAVTYTVILDNQGPANAARVWVNLTLPAFTAYDADGGFLPFNCVPLLVVGNLRPYECQDRPQVNESFWVRYRVLPGPGDGTVLTATLAVNYTDDAGVLQPEVRATASVTMSIPAITVTKTPLTNPVDPGATLRYVITVQNTGSAADYYGISCSYTAPVTGCSTSIRASAIWSVRRSCTWSRRANMSTNRATLDSPTMRPFGV